MTTSPTNKKTEAKKALTVESLSKKYQYLKRGSRDGSFKNFYALKDLSFEVNKGEVVGIIGRNGAGKSTLLNLIAGVLTPTQGKVEADGKINGLFSLGIGFQDELTGRENVFLNGSILGATQKELEAKLDAIIAFSELGEFIDMPLGSYSLGMRLRLGFGIVANLDYDILVMDEVLAVGDIAFQSKCFELLMEFKRQGKTLIVTHQSLDLIERLSDKVLVLDHGRLVYFGEVAKGLQQYQSLLSDEKFYVGPSYVGGDWIEETKKWANDKDDWGSALGAKEVEITSVSFLNSLGKKNRQFKSGSAFKVKIEFIAKQPVRDVHFGVAIFREDGVYCYGPNTSFDDQVISLLEVGKGELTLDIQRLYLTPGKYRVSIAIWDKTETLAYDYRVGYYGFEVKGEEAMASALVEFPCHYKKSGLFSSLPFQKQKSLPTQNDLKLEYTQQTDPSKIEFVRFVKESGEVAKALETNMPATLEIQLSESPNEIQNRKLWVGIFRDDDVLCSNFLLPLERKKNYSIEFPSFPLLPGEHKVSIGIWDLGEGKFINMYKDFFTFKMVSKFKDHGTIYLDHEWNFKFKRNP